MSADSLQVHCVRHGGDMFGCTVSIDGAIASFIDGRLEGRTIEQVTQDVREHEIRNRAAPIIVAPDYAVRLANARRVQEISLKTLADRLRVTPAVVSDWERGRATPPTWKLAHLWALFVGLESEEAEKLFARAELPYDFQPGDRVRILSSKPGLLGDLTGTVVETTFPFTAVPDAFCVEMDPPAGGIGKFDRRFLRLLDGEER